MTVRLLASSISYQGIYPLFLPLNQSLPLHPYIHVFNSIYIPLPTPSTGPPRPTLTSDGPAYSQNDTATLTCAADRANTFLFNKNGHVVRHFDADPTLVITGTC